MDDLTSELGEASAHSTQRHKLDDLFSEASSTQDVDGNSRNHQTDVDRGHKGGIGMDAGDDASLPLELANEGSLFVQDDDFGEEFWSRQDEGDAAPVEEGLGPRIEVRLPEMPHARRHEFVETFSEVVELVRDKIDTGDGPSLYHVAFTDGRDDLISHSELIHSQEGSLALSKFLGNGSMASYRKRKYDSEDDWGSGADSPVEDLMELDDDDADEQDELLDSSRSNRTTRTRTLRSRESKSRTTSRLGSREITEEDEDDEEDELVAAPSGSRRNLRTRPPRQASLYTTADQDPDELLDSQPQPEDDADFFVISDITPLAGRRKGARSRRLQSKRAKPRKSAQGVNRRKSPDSDIEFEAPRRSSRSTRNMSNMQDDTFMDDDESFYVVDTKVKGAPKVATIKEIFPPPPPDSDFATYHMSSCHTCGSSSQRSQLVYCQGCSLSFHKGCIGFRSAREHMATKVGEDHFVLQCRFCIDIYKKKDSLAPEQSKCQGCKKRGRACVPFSAKKTSRQEEKLREENGGVDPITPVSPDLIDNKNNVLLRCVSCHRGWHPKHLSSNDEDAIGTDIVSEAVKDFSVNWQCDECTSATHKIHRLVAWRPTRVLNAEDTKPSFSDVTEDDREYLIKWESRSYFDCSWMPGAWVFGIAAGSMRSTFAKRADSQDLLKFTNKEAIPDEYLIIDIIFIVKMKGHVPRLKTKEEELENIDNVSKVLVKYQGLGYDDVVWDSPPGEDTPELYKAFTDAYHDYLEGKYFPSEPHSRIRDRIKAFQAAEFSEVQQQPAGLRRGKLMGYQVEGLNWLLGNYHQGRSVVLADEMGLGKTVQVVSLVTSLIQDEPKCWPFLIVVPNSTCPNWRREFKQWTPDLRVVTYHGGKEPQELAYKYELFPNGSTDMKAHVVVMSYDSAQDPKTKVLFNTVHWAGLVVDEGQRLKNDQNLLYIALKSMKIPFRLLLTGTPLQNNKRELFNLLQFIDETQDAAKLDEEYEVLDKDTLPKLHEKIRPYFLRRTKAGVLKFLPPMAQIILPVTMTVIQEKLSKSIMAKNPQLIKAVFSNSKMNRSERSSLNNILMQLRKCLCHPFMYSEAIEERHHDAAVIHRNLVEASAKLLLLEIMLPKLKERGHRVLIFSQFLQQLDIVEDFLTGIGFDYRRLDGQISSLEKQRRIDAFNAPDSPIFAFLLSTRAGGVGINLATADTVIIMDPDFNPHQDIQALSRAHRIGQKNKVLCFQLMTKDTVEEKIMQVGRKKMALDHALIESMDDDELAGDDLESILKHGAQALFAEDYQKKSIHYDSASVDKLLDRSQIEQTKTDDKGSAETQFSYARVWANDKSGFEETLNVHEEEAPEPIGSSVWDKILAEREEEARREEERNREVLGRGGRRRAIVNYKTTNLENGPIDGIGPESDDSSDDFAAADSGDNTDDEAGGTKDAHAQHQVTSDTHPLQQDQNRRQDANHANASSREGAANAYPAKVQAVVQVQIPRKRGRPRKSDINSQNTTPGRSPSGPTGQTERPGPLTASNPAGPSTANYAAGPGPWSGHGPPFPQPLQQNPQPYPYRGPPAPVSPMLAPPTLYSNGGTPMSEAQLRLAIDGIRRSSLTPQLKDQQINRLLHQLRHQTQQHGGTS